MKYPVFKFTLACALFSLAFGANIDLSGYHLIFNEEFETLNVSAWGPCGPGGSRWIAHTPGAMDFGDALFTDPEPGFPFTIDNGILRIEANKDSGYWRSGILASADSQQQGSMPSLGYFEARIKNPPGPGTWPGFWINNHWEEAELDIMEHYGHHPEDYQSVLHMWDADIHELKTFLICDRLADYRSCLTEDFHTYGMEISDTEIAWYFDREEKWRRSKPDAANVGYYFMVNLALGSGWPIENTPDPSYMYVDYVKVWQPGPSPFAIALSSPNGDEQWPAGSRQTITWSSEGDLEYVILEYDVGYGWTLISSPVDTGLYVWTVPDNVTTQARLRVSAGSGAVEDESDGLFSITAPMSVNRMLP
jgi:hypothetical protein